MAVNFVLQPGIYLAQLSIGAADMVFAGSVLFAEFNVVVQGGIQSPGFAIIPGVAPLLPVAVSPGAAFEALVPVNGNVLLQVTAPNSVVGFHANFGSDSARLPFGCEIVFTRLQ
jgi:hypothetical protein